VAKKDCAVREGNLWEGLGANHPETLKNKGAMAQMWINEGETERAKAELLVVVEGFERDLGPEHSWTQWAKRVLARCDQ
jgi:hypothetical protein